MTCGTKHTLVVLLWCVLVACGTVAKASARTDVRDAEERKASVEEHLPIDQPAESWYHDPDRVAVDEGDTTEMRDAVAPDVKTVKLDNLVPAIHFGLGKVEIPDSYLAKLRDVLDRMRDRANVRLHFIGHADSLPLRDELAARYGDNLGLSRERAGTVAEYCQHALNLPPEAISYEGLGDTQPLADNATEQGRQQNRRVAVQVWYDEIGEKQIEKEVVVPREVNRIKVCRTETVCMLRYLDGHTHRARVKNLILPMHYDEGMAEVSEVFVRQIRQALGNLKNKQNVVVKFIGYTDNFPLTDRDKRIYGDHFGLSKAVARRVSQAVQERLGLANEAVESEGRGSSPAPCRQRYAAGGAR